MVEEFQEKNSWSCGRVMANPKVLCGERHLGPVGLPYAVFGLIFGVSLPKPAHC